MDNIDLKIKQMLRETINEYLEQSYDDLRGGKHNLPIVYQLAKRDRVEKIFKNGFSREYAATAGGNYYCTGLYTTFDLQSTLNNSQDKADLYGDVIIKMAIKSYDRFFICNKKIAREVYGDKYRMEDQLEILFEKYPQILQNIRNHPNYSTIIQTSSSRTAQNVAALLEVLGGMQCRADDNLNRFDIRGFVFYGANDGYVAIIRDFKAIVPLAYSLDKARTTDKSWRNDLFTEKTYSNTAGDYDPIIFLGNDISYYKNPKSFRMINGYMKVQRAIDGHYNFLDKDKNLLSPIWFKLASDMNKDQMALVKDDDGDTFYINPYGFFNSPDDDYPFAQFSDIG
ncbi:MAG: hypothetical protein IKT40_05885 [Bacilli bacterium]|nr:hypothetical protein [Bacilli bacterium]